MNSITKVYLSGPIAGYDFDGCTGWRNEVETYFWQTPINSGKKIEFLSPLRGKEYLKSEEVLTKFGYDKHPLSTTRGIITRDMWDTTRADIVFVNLLGASAVSIGTVSEIAWAYLKQIPIILVMEDEGNIHEHAFMDEMIGFRTNDLLKGCGILRALV